MKFSPWDLRKATRLTEAGRLTQAGRLTDATAALQRMLGNLSAPGLPCVQNIQAAPTIDGALDSASIQQTGPGSFSRIFSNQAGSRPYKLYVPDGYNGQPVPLIIMLHGCTQSPDDFAIGTQMNSAANARTCLVAYPGQTSAANTQKCWNWFSASDQQRDNGEPSLIAGITRQVMHNYVVDPKRVYVAGLSAGGAAASIMGNAYPDLYAAIGVHSGLAYGAAHDMQSAFTAMQRGGDGAIPLDNRRVVPTIVFHGERDSTVNPRNSTSVVAQAIQGAQLRIRQQAGQVPNGHAYTLTSYIDAGGNTLVETWIVQGAGHAWSGGSPAGSYTDPLGPDATKEMLRFFLEHPL
jgi:poly(hydroxyalkanoate) depolymerase family esterase